MDESRIIGRAMYAQVGRTELTRFEQLIGIVAIDTQTNAGGKLEIESKLYVHQITNPEACHSTGKPSTYFNFNSAGAFHFQHNMLKKK